MLWFAALLHFLDAPHQVAHTRLTGGGDGIVKQLADDLVAVRRDANPFALAHQITDHACAGIRLARARWPLYGQHRMVKHCSQALGGVHGGLTS